ncbi:MAG: ATP synthase F1 subunit gamma [Vampirovibrionales bacterium]
MPNLKDIRRRIKSVKSTQKITQAMKMVAAAKVKRAENAMKASRPFTDELKAIFLQALKGYKPSDDALLSNPVLSLLKPRSVKAVALVVMMADRGLCGGYNTTLIKALNAKVDAYVAQGIRVRVYPVGNKAIQAVKRLGDKVQLAMTLHTMSVQPKPIHGTKLARHLVEQFLKFRIDSIEVLSTRFQSMVQYHVEHQVLLPLTVAQLTESMYQESLLHASEDATLGTHLPSKELLLEPSPQDVLNTLIPMVLARLLYSLLLEAAASELSARMTAMSNATKNASELVARLALVYNKARQSAITQELLEVVGGSEALKAQG